MGPRQLNVLGIRIQDTEDGPRGVKVLDVEADSPADQRPG